MSSCKPKNLNRIDDMSAEILSRLKEHTQLLQQIEFSEDFETHPALSEIVRELDAIAICEAEGIVGVHYTRGEQGHFSRDGLVPCSGYERRIKFLEEHGYRFSSAQLERLKQGWQSYFTHEQNKVRDGRVWFNLTRVAMSNGGAEPLLSHYGGEVVYMPFSQDTEIESILREIGSPLIIECALYPRNARTFCEHPWGRTWLSSYHCTVNPDALQWDVDLYTEEPIDPGAILNIEVVEVD
ncbi:hypothetical protein [Nodosilinea sp. P-1105]|uniref:hypothetical protein n=1 Tax=Nodosilinea sp. P-1105 TaxID=2546229 RepID=UPI00146D50D1|nr:hypothetical protein [Nodosilinea sp. P-1105]NMF85398.1 hypothetical protein [Nodosilinea sp. P-1105]